MAQADPHEGDLKGPPFKVMGFRPRTLAEATELRERIAASGLSNSEFLRRAALKSEVVIHRSAQMDPALIRELNLIGRNLNQLVRKAHLRDQMPPGLEGVCAQIEALVLQVAEASLDDCEGG